MTNVQRITLGPDTAPLAQGRSPHGKWRYAYHRAAAPETDAPTPAALVILEDADRLAFALCSGEVAAYLAERLADFLWTRESLGDDWPVNLREWLDDSAQWTDAPDGRAGFICGRVERNLPGGRIHLAWLGMNGIRVQDRSDGDLTLDTAIGENEGWTRDNGPEPPGLALHAYRGSLFGLDRLLLTSPGAEPLRDDLPDMAKAALAQALEDWAEEAEHDLVLVDLRLTPVLTAPNRVVVNYRWVSPDLCMLFWQPAPNATAYRVEESPTPGFEQSEMLAELVDGRQTQYKLSPPTSASRYYRVIPLNQGVPGEPSEPLCTTPVVLNAPILQPISWAQDGGYLLEWSPIEQATSYEVQVSAGIDFDPYESEIIYRGELAEVYLPPSTKSSLFYRVRAINVLYASQTPSSWSQPRRTPSRLRTPRISLVTHARIEWEPVLGAQQYAVRVTALGEDEDQGEDVLTRDTMILSANQPATYSVCAYRHPEDLQTVSEWSDAVTLAPKEVTDTRGTTSRAIAMAILAAAVVALLVGAALGMGGIEAYQRARATSTRTPYPEVVLEQTRDAATVAVMNATAADRLGTRIAQTAQAMQDATDTATLWTQTPTPTHTFTPSNTPNLTQTVDVAFAAGLVATATAASPTPSVTPSPTPTLTLTPSNTPNMTETVDVAFVAGLAATATAASPTPLPTLTLTPSNTPNMTGTVGVAFVTSVAGTAAAASPTSTPTHTFTPSNTPNLTETVDAAFAAGLAATAAAASPTPSPTHTFTPSNTPNMTATVEAVVADVLAGTAAAASPTPEPPTTLETPLETQVWLDVTAIAAEWTPTPLPPDTPVPPTPDVHAIVSGYLATGCYVVSLPDAPLPVYEIPSVFAPVVLDELPLLAAVDRNETMPDGDASVTWLHVVVEQDGAVLTGWVRGMPGGALIGGVGCPQ